MSNGGDVLARGGKSAQFGPPKVTAERWRAIWETDTVTVNDLVPEEKNEIRKPQSKQKR